MSGKPQYDESAVVLAAIDVFWRQGYAAASINDLTAATALSRSSLYQRFGDKDGLFREALEKYTDRAMARMESVQAESPRERLRNLLREFLPREGRNRRPPGCLLARSCSEMTNLTDSARADVATGVGRQRAVLDAVLREAVSRGELAPDADVDALAWHFLGVMQSMMNMAQIGIALPMLERVIDVAMSAWPATKGAASATSLERTGP